MKNLALIHSLERNVELIFSLFGSGIDDRRFKEKEGSKISVYDHVHKLSASQEIFFHRIELFVREREPVIHEGIERVIPVSYADTETPLHTLLENFTGWRKKQVELIVSADAWEKTGICFEDRRFCLETLIGQILRSDSFHMNQIRELRLLKEKILTDEFVRCVRAGSGM